LVVPTFNNKGRNRYLKNLKSILMQNYTNYRLLVIDDGSNDGTGTAIVEELHKQTRISADRYSVVIHKERHFAMPNLRWAANYFCRPNDIFMIVDGDDELLGRQVLKLFNSVFQSKGVWFMYTNFLGSNGKMGYSRPYPSDIIENNTVR
jgi:glycosyltransferase involved in cell wall biosynthesis